jgi:hypothetical protein
MSSLSRLCLLLLALCSPFLRPSCVFSIEPVKVIYPHDKSLTAIYPQLAPSHFSVDPIYLAKGNALLFFFSSLSSAFVLVFVFASSFSVFLFVFGSRHRNIH